jgi:hypothetical protein
MNTYLVTLADRSTGKDQRILVQSVDSNNMQEFVESDAVRPTLSVNDPVVIAVHQLRVNRPHRTVFLALEKTNG